MVDIDVNIRMDQDQPLRDKESEQDTGVSRKQLIAVGQAIFVTILWASSWVIIKFGLEQENLPPLVFSGLRYTFASIILVVAIVSRSEYRSSTRSLNRRWWSILALYGVIFVSITQGAQFVGLFFLDATMVSVLLNLTPILVLLMAAMSLRETPSKGQTLLIVLGVFGAMLYFYPLDLLSQSLLGIAVVLVGVIANALSSILGRYINKDRIAPPVVITGISMAIGSAILLTTGLILEEFTTITPMALFYVAWLAVVNTALAFTIWNKAMQTLRAIDITIINSTMLPQIVVLSILFLGESLTPLDWVGLIILIISVTLVQVNQAMKENNHG